MNPWKAPLAAATSILLAAGLASPASAAPRGDFRPVPLPFFWPNNSLLDIDAASPDSVWIAGDQGALFIPTDPFNGITIPGNPVVRRWQNGAWVEYGIQNLSSHGTIDDVDAVGPEDVWISGTKHHDSGLRTPYAAHFTGTGFTQVELPENAQDGGADLRADASGIWLTTRNDYYRRTGNGWTHLATGPDVYRHTSYIRADDDIWVLGAASQTETALLARHWDGRSWRSVPMQQPPTPYVAFTDMIALSPADAWAIGVDRYTSPHTPALMHWDGSAWTSVTPPAGFDDFKKIVRGEDGTLWVVGHLTDEPAEPGLLRYSGGTWERVPTAAVPGKFDFNASALAVVPGTGALWTLGRGVVGGPVVLTDG
ncbi:hypothetical protein E1281_22275 [Actinomadura sp. KC345]|uniref:hypothetical protein n=1 Tax=Actinomadura sp. KC345 TaxID=2530371 RepID=UPI0010533F38|nr:hypothetical protein [Actinomadura sp. KC345]TDC50251.1 hypothetical protein E1281_22275 [Actinomadura sp. KC345]